MKDLSLESPPGRLNVDLNLMGGGREEERREE